MSHSHHILTKPTNKEAQEIAQRFIKQFDINNSGGIPEHQMSVMLQEMYGFAQMKYTGDHEETKAWYKIFNGGHAHNMIQSYDIEALLLKYSPGEDFEK